VGQRRAAHHPRGGAVVDAEDRLGADARRQQLGDLSGRGLEAVGQGVSQLPEAIVRARGVGAVCLDVARADLGEEVVGVSDRPAIGRDLADAARPQLERPCAHTAA
jgi:hypothetical protein